MPLCCVVGRNIAVACFIVQADHFVFFQVGASHLTFCGVVPRKYRSSLQDKSLRFFPGEMIIERGENFPLSDDTERTDPALLPYGIRGLFVVLQLG